MFFKTKYIRTKDNQIIVFSGLMEHKKLKHLEPVSAGFISFGIGADKNPDCTCYGESVGLDLKSKEVEDTILARKQILNLID